MHVQFTSSHVGGDFSSGRLVVQAALEQPSRGISEVREFFFEVPPDFCTHNDLVAAALLALIGRGYTTAGFNFPISERCARLLAWVHQLENIGPVDASLEPRRPGTHLGVTFSGGLDSLAVWVLVRDYAGIPFKLITGEFEGYYREAVGYAPYRRDVSCYTNFRRVIGEVGRRFDVVIPLLFADYADLGAFTTGHTFASGPMLWNDPRLDAEPEFLWINMFAEAAGLPEVHLVRGLDTAGVLQFLYATAPETLERGMHVTSRPGTTKYRAKASILEYLFRRDGASTPSWLANMPRDRVWEGMPVDRYIHLWAIWQWRFLDAVTARRYEPRIAQTDWSALEPYGLEFFWRYNTHLAQLIPAHYRERVLAGLRANGVQPMTAQDDDELEHVRRFIIATNPPGAMAESGPPPGRPS